MIVRNIQACKQTIRHCSRFNSVDKVIAIVFVFVLSCILTTNEEPEAFYELYAQS